MASRLLSPAVSAALLCWTICGAGCSQLTQAEIKALETREMDLGFDESYKAAANGLFSLGFAVSHSDKPSGLLSGSRHDPRTGARVANTLFFGVLGLAATSERNEAVTFMLSPIRENRTQLRMKVVVNGRPVVDRQFMTRIWQQIEREAMLESRPSDHGDVAHRPPKSAEPAARAATSVLAESQ